MEAHPPSILREHAALGWLPSKVGKAGPKLRPKFSLSCLAATIISVGLGDGGRGVRELEAKPEFLLDFPLTHSTIAAVSGPGSTWRQ